jgi:hypothetical protein
MLLLTDSLPQHSISPPPPSPPPAAALCALSRRVAKVMKLSCSCRTFLSFVSHSTSLVTRLNLWMTAELKWRRSSRLRTKQLVRAPMLLPPQQQPAAAAAHPFLTQRNSWLRTLP